MGGSGELWWERDEDKAHDELIASAKSLRESQSSRVARARVNLRAFEGREMPTGTLDAWQRNESGAAGKDEQSDRTHNLLRSACLTAVAEVAGRSRPKPQVVTTGADWTTRRRAQRKDRYFEGEFQRRQGAYSNFWAFANDICLDAMVFSGGGWGKLYWDDDDQRVRVDRVLADIELFVDDSDARYRDPRTMYQIRTAELSVLEGEYPEHAEEIRRMRTQSKIQTYGLQDGTTDTIDSVVEWVEVWRLGRGGEDGRHIVAIPGLTLHDEPWARKRFPFIQLRWQWERVGFWSQSLTDEVLETQSALNKLYRDILDSVHKGSQYKVFYEEDSIDTGDLDDGSPGVMVQVQKGAQFPKTEAATAISRDHLQLWEILSQAVYRLPGVSEAGATARKEQGADSGKAIRLIMDQQSKRFMIFAKDFEQLFADAAELWDEITAEAFEEAKAEGRTLKLESRLSSAGVMTSDTWTPMAEDTYAIQVYPVAALPSTPGGRMATVQEMIGSGMISQSAGRELLDWPDLEKHSSRSQSVRRIGEKIIQGFLDAGTEFEPEEYTPPIPDPQMLLGGLLQEVMVQVTAAYFEAMLDDAPDENLDMFRSYLTDCSKVLDKAAAAKQPPAAPGVPGTPPGGPGAPQLLPPALEGVA